MNSKRAILLGLFSLLICGNVRAQEPAGSIKLSPLFSFSDLSGDKDRFREDRQIPTGVAGGIESFSFDNGEEDKNITVDGRALSERDFGTKISLLDTGHSYLNINLDTFRWYYDSSNLFYGDNVLPGGQSINVFEADDKLYTDRSVYGIETGLNFADNKKVYLGFEHTQRDGKTNAYYGGWIRQTSADNWIVWNYPLSPEVESSADKLYSGFDTVIAGFKSAFKLGWESFASETEYTELGQYTNGTDIFNRFYKYSPDSRNLTGSINAERYFLKDKLLCNFSYSVQKTDTTADFDQDSFTPAGARYYAEHSLNFIQTEHSGKNTTQSVNLLLSAFPVDWLKVWSGLEFRIGKAKNDSIRGEEGVEGVAADNNTSTIDERWFFDTVAEEQQTRESFGIDISSLPKTKITLSADFDQKKTEYDQDANIVEIFNGTDDGDWHWRADVKDCRNRYNASVRSRPLDWLIVSGKYRYMTVDSDVNNIIRTAEGKPGDPEYDATIATNLFYPGRIGDWQRPTHKFNLDFTAKLNPRLSLRPHYEYLEEEFFVSGDYVDEISTYQSNAYGLGIDLSPTDKLTLALDITQRDAVTATRANDFTNSENINPATGAASTQWFGGLTDDFDGSYSLFSGALTYQLRKGALNFNSSYTEGKGWFATESFNTGLGLIYPLKDNTDLKAGYSYGNYEEKNNGGINDYEAHIIYAGLNIAF